MTILFAVPAKEFVRRGGVGRRWRRRKRLVELEFL